MSWQELLQRDFQLVLPWYGDKQIHSAERSWILRSPLPPEHGWYFFNLGGGRYASLVSGTQQTIDPDYVQDHPVLKGYVVGDRFIQDHARVDPDPSKLIQQTRKLHCVELGLERFTRGLAVVDRGQNLVYGGQEFPLGPEIDVLEAFQDRKESVSDIPNVTPALDLAFRWISYQRERAEERRRELERIRAEEEAKRAAEERLQEAMKNAGTAVGRRVLAQHDFESAAREALRVSGSELLDVRESRNRGEMVVQYRFRRQRLECVVDRNTLNIIDAGICLEDHETGIRGDTWLSLESISGVVGQAMDEGKLVIWRHV